LGGTFPFVFALFSEVGEGQESFAVRARRYGSSVARKIGELVDGKWLKEEECDRFAASQPELYQEWQDWLLANLDPGNYEAYKDKSTVPSTWTCDTFCPQSIVDRMIP
jgi:hypothetical protein